MYEKKYVKRRKRKKIAAISGLASSCGIGALVIVAFLGRYVGTFTVTLNTSGVELSLSQTKDFKESTTVLTINYLPPYHECTYSDIVAREDILDSEATDYLEGAQFGSLEDEQKRENPLSLDFFKYTFYVKNVGTTSAKYDFKINIIENKPDEETGKRYLDSCLRVALYENWANDDDVHLSKVYAKSSTRPNRDEEGKVTYREYISASKDQEDENNRCYGFAEEFEAEDRVATFSVKDFNKDDIKRYTILTWLEGQDPESDNNKSAPVGASLKLGVEINAYENE